MRNGLPVQCPRCKRVDWSSPPNRKSLISSVPCSSGVYELYRDGVCMYVGSSLNMRGRLGGHSKRNFDKIVFTEFPPERLSEEEVRAISRLNPTENILLSGGRGGALSTGFCSKGHLMADPNLYHRGDGKRECLACKRERNRGRKPDAARDESPGGEVRATRKGTRSGVDGKSQGDVPLVPKTTASGREAKAAKSWFPSSKCRHGWQNSFLCERNGGGCGR